MNMKKAKELRKAIGESSFSGNRSSSLTLNLSEEELSDEKKREIQDAVNEIEAQLNLNFERLLDLMDDIGQEDADVRKSILGGVREILDDVRTRLPD